MKGVFIITVFRRPLERILFLLLLGVVPAPVRADIVVPGVSWSPKSTVLTEISI